MSNKILILGASGFIGNVLYKELLSYYDVYGTYCSQAGVFEENQVFFQYDVEEGGLDIILAEIEPNIIISSIHGNFGAQLKAHELLIEYCFATQSKIVFLSSAFIFDGKGKYPSYEKDSPEATSAFGKFKISIERLIKQLPQENYVIARLPMILGVNSPQLDKLQLAVKNQTPFEVFPNLIITVTTADKIAQQIHYIINQKLGGVFHLASSDMVHHEDIFREISEKLSDQTPIFKSVFGSNEDTYLALLPKENKLPKPHRITVAEVIDDSTLKEEITTFKS